MSIKNIQDSLKIAENITNHLETIDENKDNIASNLEKINDLSNSIKL